MITNAKNARKKQDVQSSIKSQRLQTI